MQLQLPPIYPITDAAISGLSIPEQVRQMIAGGARFIQVREKKASSREFFEAARDAAAIAHSAGARLIVNDRVDIAMMAGADGVHLGQEDLPPVHARRLLGKDAIIGWSTHSIEQAREAVRLPIDYVAFGPVFPTATKERPDSVVGIDILAEVKVIAGSLPVVAIGGIRPDDVGRVLSEGADAAALISGLLTPPDQIAAKVGRLLAECSTDDKPL